MKNKNLTNKSSVKILTMILLIFFCSFQVFANDNDYEMISINLLNQNPDPVFSGDIVEIILSIQNTGYGIIDNANLIIEDQYPFEILSQNDIELTNIFSSTNYAQNIKLRIKIDSNVKTGTYPLVIKEYTNSNLIAKEHTIYISINSNNNIEIIDIDKNHILPGDSENVTFTIKNVGKSTLRDIFFLVEDSENYILPINNDNSKYIDSLNIGEEKNITFTLSASPIITPDIYPLKLIINYDNEGSEENNVQTTNFGLYVGGETNFDIIYNQHSNQEYVFSIINIGPNDAKAIKVSINEKSGFQTQLKNSEIIGNLNLGDYTSFSFVFEKDIGNLIFNIDYTDTFQNRKTQEKQINLNLNPNLNNTQAEKFSQRQPGSRLNTDNTQTITQPSRNPLSSLNDGTQKIKENLVSYTIYLIIGLIVVIFIIKIIGKKIKNNNN